MRRASVIEAAIRRDRLVVLAGLLCLTALAWLYLIAMAAGMSGAAMDHGGAAMAMPEIKPWSALDFVLMFLMWAIMMVGMMVPSAAPMILLFARVSRQAREPAGPLAPTSAFVGGYLAAWSGFSLAATGLQWALEQAALLSPMMVVASPVLGAVLLIIAGIYQWTPLKHSCLQHCRSPLYFVVGHWRRGTGGAFAMGLHHGAYCIGCCWFLMALLFVAGVMNLLWIAAIAAFVLLEKIAPWGPQIGRASGVLLVLAGVALLVQG